MVKSFAGLQNQIQLNQRRDVMFFSQKTRKIEACSQYSVFLAASNQK